jgi:hypothetical protein
MDANLSTLAYQRETTWGTTPVSPALKKTRFTGETLIHEKETIVTAEIRPDRQVSDIVKVAAMAKGDISFEFNFTDFQHWLEAAVMGEIATLNVSAVTCSLTHTTQVVAAAAGTFDNVQIGCTYKFAGAATSANNGLKRVVSKVSDGSAITLAAGSLTATEASVAMTITGKGLKNGITPASYFIERKIPASAGGYKYQRFNGMQPDTFELNFESKAIVTGKIGFMGAISAVSETSLMALTAVAASQTLTFVANPSNNDTVTVGSKTYTYKTSLTGAANEVLIGGSASASLDNLIAAINGAAGAGTTYGTGTIASTQVTAAAGAGDTMIVTAITAGVAGNSIATTETFTNAGNVWTAATLTGGTDATAYVEPSSDTPVNATNNVGTIERDGAAMSEKFKKLTLSIANNLRGRDCIGTEGNFSLGVGTFDLTGSMESYFRDNSLIASIITHEDTSISYRVTDDQGNVLVFFIPRLVFASGNANVSAKDTDVMVPLDLRALRHPDYDATILVSFIEA